MMDDTGVPVITGMLVSEGWQTEMVSVGGWTEMVFVAPDGRRFVEAMAQERADLIVRKVSPRFSQPIVKRLRIQKGSAAGRKIKKEQQATIQRAKRVRRKK